MSTYALASDIGPNDSPIALTSTYSLTGTYPGRVTCESEVMYVTGGNGTTHVSVLRGCDGTDRASHSIGTAFADANIPTSAGGGTFTLIDSQGNTFPDTTTVITPGVGAQIAAGTVGVGLVFHLLGPVSMAFDTPGFMSPPTNMGPVVFTIPAGSIALVWGGLTTAFNQPGNVQVQLSPDPADFPGIGILTLYGTSGPQTQTGAIAESFHVIADSTVVHDLDASLARWFYTPDERFVVASYQPDASNATAGAVTFYALVASPAA